MSNRKNIKLSQERFQMLKEQKPDHMTWGVFFKELVENQNTEGKKWTEAEVETKIKDMVVREALK